MAGKHTSTKKMLIDKASSTIVVSVAISALLVSFSLVAIHSLLGRRAYQSKVITAQEQARDQLQSNIDAVDGLKKKYNAYIDRQENILGGNSRGSGGNDGDNAKIVLDALPSKYDYPALISSIEKILIDRNFKIKSISGIDNESIINGTSTADPAAQLPVPAQSTAGAADTTGQPTGGAAVSGAVEMPFQLSAEGSYANMTELLSVFQRSIRPLHILSLKFEASSDGAALTVQAKSYYQPEKTLNISEEVMQ